MWCVWCLIHNYQIIALWTQDVRTVVGLCRVNCDAFMIDRSFSLSREYNQVNDLDLLWIYLLSPLDWLLDITFFFHFQRVVIIVVALGLWMEISKRYLMREHESTFSFGLCILMWGDLFFFGWPFLSLNCWNMKTPFRSLKLYLAPFIQYLWLFFCGAQHRERERGD